MNITMAWQSVPERSVVYLRMPSPSRLRNAVALGCVECTVCAVAGGRPHKPYSRRTRAGLTDCVTNETVPHWARPTKHGRASPCPIPSRERRSPGTDLAEYDEIRSDCHARSVSDRCECFLTMRQGGGLRSPMSTSLDLLAIQAGWSNRAREQQGRGNKGSNDEGKEAGGGLGHCCVDDRSDAPRCAGRVGHLGEWYHNWVVDGGSQVCHHHVRSRLQQQGSGHCGAWRVLGDHERVLCSEPDSEHQHLSERRSDYPLAQLLVDSRESAGVTCR